MDTEKNNLKDRKSLKNVQESKGIKWGRQEKKRQVYKQYPYYEYSDKFHKFDK